VSSHRTSHPRCLSLSHLGAFPSPSFLVPDHHALTSYVPLGTSSATSTPSSRTTQLYPSSNDPSRVPAIVVVIHPRRPIVVLFTFILILAHPRVRVVVVVVVTARVIVVTVVIVVIVLTPFVVVVAHCRRRRSHHTHSFIHSIHVGSIDIDIDIDIDIECK
jgi:hypothetical protein